MSENIKFRVGDEIEALMEVHSVNNFDLSVKFTSNYANDWWYLNFKNAKLIRRDCHRCHYYAPPQTKRACGWVFISAPTAELKSRFFQMS